jgi:hypothetical protein
MALDLSGAELATAAMACRACAHQEGERAEGHGQPGDRGPIEAAAERYAMLAMKFERARIKA